MTVAAGDADFMAYVVYTVVLFGVLLQSPSAAGQPIKLEDGPVAMVHSCRHDEVVRTLNMPRIQASQTYNIDLDAHG